MAVPAFRRLWLAGLVSDTGDWLMFIALPLVVLQLTGSAVGTSIAFLLELAPPVLLAPVVARITDRLSHRLVMVVAMVGQALTLLPLLLVHTASDLPVIYGVIVAQASFGAFFLPAKNALLPTLVGLERANSANALVGLNNDLGRIVGGPLGGVLLAVGSLSAIALMDVASYVVAAALVLSLPRERRTNPGGYPSKHPGTPKPSGVLHALADQPTRHLILVNTVASVAQGLFLVLFVFFVTDVIRGNAADVGLLRGVQAIGAIGAGLALGVLGAKIDALRLALIGASTFTVITVLCWNASFVTHAVPLYAMLFATIGVPAVFMGAGLTSLLQQATHGAHRGSAFAALGLGQAIGQAIGITAAGLLQEPLGTLPLLEIQAGTYALTALLAFILLPHHATRPANPRHHNLLRARPVDHPQTGWFTAHHRPSLDSVEVMSALSDYIDAWKQNDPAAIVATVTPDVVVIESYGPVYRGAPTVLRWAESWLAAGGRVLGWTITNEFTAGDRIAVEWLFECHWDGADHAFDGSTLATVRDGKIARLREYATSAPLYDWE